MVKKTATPKPTKADVLIAEIMQNYAHVDTNVIVRKRISLRTDVELAETEINELTARLTDVRASKAANESLIAGLGSVIDKRK